MRRLPVGLLPPGCLCCPGRLRRCLPQVWPSAGVPVSFYHALVQVSEVAFLEATVVGPLLNFSAVSGSQCHPDLLRWLAACPRWWWVRGSCCAGGSLSSPTPTPRSTPPGRCGPHLGALWGSAQPSPLPSPQPQLSLPPRRRREQYPFYSGCKASACGRRGEARACLPWTLGSRLPRPQEVSPGRQPRHGSPAGRARCVGAVPTAPAPAEPAGFRARVGGQGQAGSPGTMAGRLQPQALPRKTCGGPFEGPGRAGF